MNEVIDQIVKTGRVTDAEGEVYEPVSAVSLESGGLLYDFVRRVKPTSTLETGMAYGMSTLFICKALQDNGQGCHAAIDPFQACEFKSVGVLNVERAGLSHRFRLHQAASDVVLPQLCAEGRTLDFAFVDGWHLFDFTLVGKALRATALNRTGARLMGIRPARAGTIAYLLGSLMAGVSGILIQSVLLVGVIRPGTP